MQRHRGQVLLYLARFGVKPLDLGDRLWGELRC
jgi:uncharacterized damage-inducible protein DinB